MVGMPPEGSHLHACAGVPQLDRLVLTPADDPLAVLAERHALHPAGVSLKGENLPSCAGVPHLHRVVLAPGDEALAIQTEHRAAGICRDEQQFTARIGSTGAGIPWQCSAGSRAPPGEVVPLPAAHLV